MIKIPGLEDPDYRRLWLGAACNQQGMSGEHVILGLLVFQITQSTAWVGIILAVYFLPMFVFGMLSGAIADWTERRVLLRRIELAIIVSHLGFAALLYGGLSNLWMITALTLALGSLRAMHQPVRASYAYDIVGGQRVVAGLGLLNLGSRSGQLIGALLAGWIMHRFGGAIAVLALAAGHLIAYVMFCRLRSAGVSAVTSRAPIRQNFREFVDELGRNRILLMLLFVTASVEIFGFSFATALPELATTRLDLGADGLGYLHAARAAGGIVAGLILTFMSNFERRGLAYLAVLFGFGVGLLFLSVGDTLILTLVAVGFVAFIAAASDVLTQSMMQLSVANELRGRAMGVWVLAVGFGPVGHLELGALSVWIGLSSALLVNGAALLAIGLIVALTVPRLRQL